MKNGPVAVVSHRAGYRDIWENIYLSLPMLQALLLKGET